MGRKAKTVDAARIASMAARGLTAEQAGAELCVSTRTAGRLLQAARGRQRLPRIDAQSPERVVRSPRAMAPRSDPAVAVDGDMAPDLVAILRKLVRSLDSRVEDLGEDDTVATGAALSRLLMAATKQLSLLTPVPRADPEDSPDFQAAAAACRAKLLEGIERAKKAAAA